MPISSHQNAASNRVRSVMAAAYSAFASSRMPSRTAMAAAARRAAYT